MINSMASYTSCTLEAIARNLCGACFIFGKPEITQFHQLRNMFVLDTKCLPFWRRERFILINIAPFVPIGSNSIIKIAAYDTGHKQDFESLGILMVWWDQEGQKFVFQELEYLPDTKKTFSRIIGGYPTSKLEMESEWQRRKGVHAKFLTQELLDLLPFISKPNLLYEVRLRIASMLVALVNNLNQRRPDTYNKVN